MYMIFLQKSTALALKDTKKVFILFLYIVLYIKQHITLMLSRHCTD